MEQKDLSFGLNHKGRSDKIKCREIFRKEESEMRKIVVFLVIVLMLTMFGGTKFTLGMTNIDKPTNFYAYSVGTTVYLRWDYTYF
ncbi:MAG: hypothetical protein DRI22_02080, partial [Caldiserica bacterium]